MRRYRLEYAVLAIAVIAMLVTSPDPATMILAIVPVYALFEGSILLARRFGRPAQGLGENAEADVVSSEATAPEGG